MTNSFVLLSYRSFERDFAARLARDLRNDGVRVWMDALDGGIEGGDDWRYRLQTALDECAGMVCVLSPDYVTSRYCLDELSRVDDRGVPIVPVLIAPLAKPSDRPFQLQRIQHLDFTSWRIESTYKTQYKRLEHDLTRKLSGIVGSRPDVETRYLNDRIAGLGSAMGVVEYVEFGLELSDSDQRPAPLLDEWGYSVLRGTADDDERHQFSSVTDLATAHPRFVLLGAPGGGKSTTLRRLARVAAYKRRENPRSNPLPLLLNLAEWSQEATPADFVRKHWPFQADPDAAIRDGDVILFLDGLNEMGSRGRARAGLLREWIKSGESPRKLVVTCRAADYDDNLRLGDVPSVSIKELTPDQVRQFARNYLEDRAPAFLREIGLYEDRLAVSHGLPALAGNPYFLRSLIELFVRPKGGGVPRNTGVLFQDLTEALWQRESRRAAGTLLPLKTLRNRLARLARAQREDQSPTHVSRAYATKKLTSWYETPVRTWLATRLLRSARNASLIRLEGDGCSFSHEMMLDYFAALSLLDHSGRTRREKVRRWMKNYRFTDDPLVALSGLALDSDELVSMFLEHRVSLAGECLASGAAVSPPVRERVVSALREAIGRDNMGWRANTLIDQLGLIGDSDPKTIILLANGLRSEAGFIAASAARALGRIATPAAAAELRRALDDPQTKASEYQIGDALASMGAVAIADLIDTMQQTVVKYQELADQPRLSSVAGLERLGKAAVPELLTALRTRKGAVRLGSALVLGRLGIVDAVPDLLRAMVEDRNRYGNYPSDYNVAFAALGEAAIAPLSAWLNDSSTTDRTVAVKALSAVGVDGIIPHLLRALQDQTQSVREAAAGAFQPVFKAAVPRLVEFVEDTGRLGAAEAAQALGFAQDQRGVSALVSLLQRGDRYTRMCAAHALGSIRDATSLEPLLTALDDDAPEVRSFAADSLGHPGHEPAIPSLIRCLALEDKEWEGVRRAAALALEKIGSAIAVEHAKAFWREVVSNDPRDTKGIEALGRMRDRAAVALLVTASKDDYFWSRYHAVQALGDIGDAQALPAIIERLSDLADGQGGTASVRSVAINALGKLKDARAIEPLANLLDSADKDGIFGLERVAELAADALEQIGTEEALKHVGEYWRRVLSDSEQYQRRRAAQALRRLRYRPATKELIAALRDTGVDDEYNIAQPVADFAALALEEIGDVESVEPIVQYWLSALKDRPTRTRTEAIKGLGRHRRLDAVPPLMALLKDPYREVAECAAEVLEQFNAPEARVALIEYRDRRPRKTA